MTVSTVSHRFVHVSVPGLTAAAAVLLAAGSAAAVDRTWVGPDLGDFLDASHWSPAGVPGLTDDLHMGFFASGERAVAGSPFTIDDLTVEGASTLFVEFPPRATVTSRTKITNEGTLCVTGDDPVLEDDGFFTDTLDLRLGGRLFLVDGALVEVSQLVQGSGSLIRGSGSLRFDDTNLPTQMEYSGRIESLGMIEIGDAESAEIIDLDGTYIEAIQGSVHILSPATFDGAAPDVIVVGGGHSVVLEDAAFPGTAVVSGAGTNELLMSELAIGGALLVGGDARIGGPPTLETGDNIIIRGAVEFDSTADAVMNTNLQPGGTLQVDGQLELGGSTVFDNQGGPGVTGDGNVKQNGDLEVVSDTTIVCHCYDWDGLGNTTTTVRQGVFFELHVDSFESVGTDNMSGNIILESATQLHVFKSDPTWTMNGTMALMHNSQIFGTPLVNSGRIEGTTSFRMDVTNSGVVAPRPGNMLVVSSDYVQTANGTLEITVGPSTLGRIGVFLFGSITIDGRLEVLIEDGWMPGIGTQYTILQDDDASLSGTFAEIDAPGFDVIYASSSVKLEFVGLPCPADVSGDDGFVDVGDLLAMLGAWGPCTCPEDINGDGVVNVGDLLGLLGGWGACP